METVEQMVQQTAENGLGAITVLLGGPVIIAVRTPELVPVFLVVVPAAALVVARLRARLRTPNEHFRHEVDTLSSRKAPRRMDGTLRSLQTPGCASTSSTAGSGRWPGSSSTWSGCVGEVLQAPELEDNAGKAERNSPRGTAPSPSRASGTRTTTAAGPAYATSPSP